VHGSFVRPADRLSRLTLAICALLGLIRDRATSPLLPRDIRLVRQSRFSSETHGVEPQSPIGAAAVKPSTERFGTMTVAISTQRYVIATLYLAKSTRKRRRMG